MSLVAALIHQHLYKTCTSEIENLKLIMAVCGNCAAERQDWKWYEARALAGHRNAARLENGRREGRGDCW
jgi:hypothetical protein